VDNKLLTPTLKIEGIIETKTYDISKLFYVAFFGGTIPTTILLARNAKWLRLSNKCIFLIYLVGTLILLSKVTVASLITGHIINFNQREIRLGVKVADVVLYLIVYFLMKERFTKHILTGGDTEPLLKTSIVWIAIGILIEFILLTIGGALGAGILR